MIRDYLPTIILLIAAVSVSIAINILRTIKKKKADFRKSLMVLAAALTVAGLIILLRVSFFNDWIDFLLIMLGLFSGPFVALFDNRHKLTTTNVVMKIITVITFFVFFVFSLITFLVGGYALSDHVIDDDGKYIKTYPFGGPAANCNYDIERRVDRFLVFERQLSNEQVSTSPDLPGCD